MSNRLLDLVWGAKPFGSERTGPTLRLVMASLADQVNEEKHRDWCFPSLLTIQQRTEMGRSTVLRALANLKEAGWISTQTRPGYGSAYYFDIEKLTAAQRPEPSEPDNGRKGTRPFTAPIPIHSRDPYPSPQETPTPYPSLEETRYPSPEEATTRLLGGLKRSLEALPILKNQKEPELITNQKLSTLALTSIEVHAGDFQLTETDNLLPKKKNPDPRNQPFLEALKTYYEQSAKMPMTWDGSEGKHFSEFLAANPLLTLADFETILNHRARSEVTHSERPRKWLPNATSFLNGPLDRFNKPPGGTNAKPGRFDEITESSREALAILDRVDNGANRNVRSLDSGGATRSIFESPDDSLVAQNSRRDR
jgi:hypothetical protein